MKSPIFEQILIRMGSEQNPRFSKFAIWCL